MGISDEEKRLYKEAFQDVKQIKDALMGTLSNPIGLLQRENTNTQFRLKWQKNTTTIVIMVIINILLVVVNFFMNYGKDLIP